MSSVITPCLWFDGQASEAATFYTSFFKNSKITQTQYYGEAGKLSLGHVPGKVMMVTFELNGQSFSALNGGPQFKFNEAISFQIMCDDQAEVDYYWDRLAEGGDPEKQKCGWVTDKFGVCWQVIPKMLDGWMTDPDSKKAGRTYEAMLAMKKLDIAALRDAHEGRGRTV
jgi:predicted 3-demethylubiquinone-9 3-methyltransferase (glyoxalase superfamily)